jgi:hypothetical protein
MTTTNNTSTSNSSNVVAKIFVKKMGKRQFSAAVKFNGNWVVGKGQQTRTAIKAAEEALAKLGAPRATWNVIKVEADGSKVSETPNVEAVKASAVETPAANNSAKAFKLDSCYAWAFASSAAVAKMLEMIGENDPAELTAARTIAYKVAYVAASRACMKQSNPVKVAKFEKDLSALGREVMFLDAVRENIINAGLEIAK